MIQEGGQIVDSDVSAYPHDLEIRKSENELQYRVVDHDGIAITDWVTFANTQDIKGDRGVGIVSVEKTATDGLVDTYTITYSDEHTSTFSIVNGAQGEQGPQGQKGEAGNGIYAIDVDSYDEETRTTTYRIVYTNQDYTTFTIKDGEPGPKGDKGEIGPKTIFRVEGNYLQYKAENASTWVNLISIDQIKGPKGETGADGKDGINGISGVGIVNIEKIKTVGKIDTYQINYTDGSSNTFDVANGADGTSLVGISWSEDKKTLIFELSNEEEIRVDFTDISKNLINVDDGEIGQVLTIVDDGDGNKVIGFTNKTAYTGTNGVTVNNQEVSADLDYLNEHLKYNGQGPIRTTVGGLTYGTDINNWTFKKLLDKMLYPYQPPQAFSIKLQQNVYEIGETPSQTLSSIQFSKRDGTDPINKLKVKYRKTLNDAYTYIYGAKNDEDEYIDDFGPYANSITIEPITFEQRRVPGNYDWFYSTVSDGTNQLSASVNVNAFTVYDYYKIVDTGEEFTPTSLIRISTDGETSINIEDGKTIYYLSKTNGTLKTYDEFAGQFLELEDDGQFYHKVGTSEITLQSGLTNQTYYVHKFTPLVGDSFKFKI